LKVKAAYFYQIKQLVISIVDNVLAKKVQMVIAEK
jgi:hypothetical protein